MVYLIELISEGSMAKGHFNLPKEEYSYIDMLFHR
jgi:hypothetical protein